MINPIFEAPADWKDLQNKVATLCRQIGLKAEIEKTIQTPRGTTEYDVYAEDLEAIIPISYIFECKNWNTAINQGVIKAFITDVHETGCNVGYIISRKGFQKGAIEYTSYTNIRLRTYEELQTEFFPIWYKRFFRANIRKEAILLNALTEPINNTRFRYEERLTSLQKEAYLTFRKEAEAFIIDCVFPIYTDVAHFDSLTQSLCHYGDICDCSNWMGLYNIFTKAIQRRIEKLVSLLCLTEEDITLFLTSSSCHPEIILK